VTELSYSKNSKSKIVWLLLLGVSTTTLYFKTTAEDPFNTPKLLILVLLGSYLIGHLVNHFRLNGIWREPGDKVVHGLSLLFICALFVSLLHTKPFLQGLIGDTQRRNGFLSYLMLVIIFLVSYHSVGLLYINRIFITASITGLIMAFYGTLQINGLDFVQWVNPYNSMIGTLGNPNFASALLAVFAAFSTFALFINSLPGIMKITAGFMIILALYCIIQSDSRQGLVTYFISVLFYVTTKSLIKFKKFNLPILLTSIGVMTLVVLGMLQKGPLAYWLYKDSVSVRGFYWRAALEMFQSNYLTGVGLDRYGNFFKFYREAEYPLRYGYEISSSNAHNTILQIFSTAGVFSGLLYIILLIHILSSGISFIRSANQIDRVYMIGLLSTWVGFQSQSFISIDNIGVSIWGWLLGGSILGMKKFNKTNSQSMVSGVKNSARVHINLFQPAVSTIGVLVSLTLVVPVYRAETDSFWVKSLGNNLTENNLKPLSDYSNRLISNSFADPNYKYRAALYLYDAGSKERAVSIVNDLALNDPKNLDYLLGLAYLYAVEKRYNLAIDTHEKISQLDPWNADNFLTLGKLYIQTNNDLFARKNLLKAISIAPNTDVEIKAREILSTLD